MAIVMINKKIRFIIVLFFIVMLFIPKNEFAITNNNNEKIILGDVNNNKKIDTNDLILILRHIYASENNKHKEWILTGNKFIAGDITQNGIINSSDTIAISRYIAAKNNPKIAKKHKNWIETIENEDNIIEVNSVTLNKSSLELEVGKEEKLKATILPENATNKTLSWSSSDTKVATVDQNGNIKTIKEGTTKITVKSSNGKKDTMTLTVKQNRISVTKISIDQKDMELEVGETKKLSATVLPSNATNKTVTWKSSNSEIVSINSSTGELTAKKEGKVTITANSENNKQATIVITVSVPSIIIDQKDITMDIGQTKKLTATISSKTITDKTITWNSSNQEIVAINSKTGSLTAKKSGKVTITASLKNGAKATTTVTVKAKNITVTSITLNKDVVTLDPEKTFQLVATVLPKNATNKKVSWKTSNKFVAYVDNNGKVTARKDGQVTITATASNGKEAKATIIVGNGGSLPTGKIRLKDKNVVDTRSPVFTGGYKYTGLTYVQKKQLAYLAYLEQGSLEGAKMELSLMCNLTEMNTSNHDLYNYVMDPNNSWWGPVLTGEVNKNSNPQFTSDFTSKFVDLVDEIMERGNRYLPKNVDEHDCESDISSISTGDKYNRNDYIPNETIIYNCYGSKYRFIGFAPNGGDPFGYTF